MIILVKFPKRGFETAANATIFSLGPLPAPGCPTTKIRLYWFMVFSPMASYCRPMSVKLFIC